MINLLIEAVLNNFRETIKEAVENTPDKFPVLIHLSELMLLVNDFSYADLDYELYKSLTKELVNYYINY